MDAGGGYRHITWMSNDPTSRRAGPAVRKVPDGDTHERLVCEDCGFVVYDNPKVVVGAVCRWQDRILLCRRAIEPRRGYWTIPAGYLELNETTAEGAMRETLEEAKARIEIDALIAVYNIPRISQVQLMYAATLLSPDVAPGIETLDARLVEWDEIPWDEMAFPSVRWALDHDRAYRSGAPFVTGTNPPGAYGDF